MKTKAVTWHASIDVVGGQPPGAARAKAAVNSNYSRGNTRIIASRMLCGLLLASTAVAAGDADAFDPVAPFCSTWEKWRAAGFDRHASASGACAPLGSCDDPTVRDRYLVDASSPVLRVKVHLVVLLKNDLTGPVVAEADLVRVMDQLNRDFAPHRVRFEYSWEHIAIANDRWRAEWAVAPATRANVFIADGKYAFGTFPWDPDHDIDAGGITIGGDYLQPPWRSLLAHEMGHTLGLWHTFHGVSEVSRCSECYERADGRDADTTGDLCSDTPPTPFTFDCFDPGGTDFCSTVDWGSTLVEDYMSYSFMNQPDCWSLFTPQQAARVRCWTQDILGKWLVDDVLYRGVVATLAAGWRPVSLPLAELNDDETVPFPVPTLLGQDHVDPNPPAEPLILYRVLASGTDDAENRLRAVKTGPSGDAVELSY